MQHHYRCVARDASGRICCFPTCANGAVLGRLGHWVSCLLLTGRRRLVSVSFPRLASSDILDLLQSLTDAVTSLGFRCNMERKENTKRKRKRMKTGVVYRNVVLIFILTLTTYSWTSYYRTAGASQLARALHQDVLYGVSACFGV